MKLSLVAPSGQAVPSCLENIVRNSAQYENTIGEIQRFRGKVYFDDNAIPATALDQQGRHYSLVDYHSWHLTIRDSSGEIVGVMRVPIYNINKNVTELLVYDLLIRNGLELQQRLLKATDEFLSKAKPKYRLLAEPGGLAVAPEFQSKLLGARLAAGSMAVMQLVGNAAALSSITVKHNAILLVKKIVAGFSSQLFYDSYHKCDIEMLLYYSDLASLEFSVIISRMKRQFESVEVLAN